MTASLDARQFAALAALVSLYIDGQSSARPSELARLLLPPKRKRPTSAESAEAAHLLEELKEAGLVRELAAMSTEWRGTRFLWAVDFDPALKLLKQEHDYWLDLEDAPRGRFSALAG